MIFVDTSAIYALLDATDPSHSTANDVLRRHIDTARFVTHNYVLVETLALVGRRLGVGARRDVVERLQPLLETRWIDATRHDQAAARLLVSRRSRASLVDQVSFDLMRELGITTAFAFDRDFEREGFQALD